MTPAGTPLDALARMLRQPFAEGGGIPALNDAQWTAVIDLANRHYLGPALYASLARTGWIGNVPADACAYLALLYRLNRRRNAVIRRQLRELVGALNEDGIEPVLLKGALALVADPPSARSTRMMADIDFLVPVTAADAALAALERLGYRLRERYPDGHHAYGEFARDGDPAAVDPHFELIDYPYLLPAAEVLARSACVHRNGLAYRVPDPGHRLFHGLLHAQIHHAGNYYRGAVDLRHLFEVATLASANDSRIDWAGLHRRMARHLLLGPLESYLLLAHRLFGAPWPYPAPPTIRARIHARRCRFQLRHPRAQRLAVPLGNLRAAFAWHRMRRRYRRYGRSALAWRWQHLRQFLVRHGIGFAVERIFRN